MGWEALIPIIARYGVQFAYTLWGNIKDKKEVTEDDWQVLLALADKSYDDYLVEARRRAGTPGVTTNPNP